MVERLCQQGLARDPASRAQIAELRDELSRLNPSAPLLDRNEAGFDLPALFEPRTYASDAMAPDVEGWLALERVLAVEANGGARHCGGDRPGGVETTSMVSEPPLRRKDLDTFLQLLQSAAGPRLLRLKGFVCLEDDPDRPLVVHAVQHSIHPPKRLDAWPTEDRRTRMVAITQGIDPTVLREIFDAATGEAKLARSMKAIAVGGLALTVLLLAGLGLVFLSHRIADAAASAPSQPTAFFLSNPTQ